MPALPADIARAQRRAAIVEYENGALKLVYAQARDMRPSPATGYFDSRTDAQTAMNARGAIIGVVRRRFALSVAEIVFPDLASGIPVWALIDDENDLNGKAITARIEIDAEEETTTMEFFG